MSAIQAFAEDLLLGGAPALPSGAPAGAGQPAELAPSASAARVGGHRERPSRWTFVFDRWAALTAPVEEFVLA